jgi:hypothetical protein
MPFTKRLLIDADAYIRDGYLKRWKHDRLHNKSSYLNLHYCYQIPLREEDIELIRKFDNVVIQSGAEIEFVNFNNKLLEV